MDSHENSLDAAGFEWDEDKRAKNILKHDIDFADVLPLFFYPHADVALKFDAEPRSMLIGALGEWIVSVIYTKRDGTIRIISARRARQNEKRAYYAVHARGDP